MGYCLTLERGEGSKDVILRSKRFKEKGCTGNTFRTICQLWRVFGEASNPMTVVEMNLDN